MSRVSQKKYPEEGIDKLVKALKGSKELHFETQRTKQSTAPSEIIRIKDTSDLGSLWKFIGESNFYYTGFLFCHKIEFSLEDIVPTYQIKQKISECLAILEKFFEGENLCGLSFYFCKAEENIPLTRGDLHKANSHFSIDASKRGVLIKGDGFSDSFLKAFQIIGAERDENYNVFKANVNNCSELREFIEYIVKYSENEGCRMFVDPIFMEFFPYPSSKELVSSLAEFMSTNPGWFKGRLRLMFDVDKVFSNLKQVNPFFETAKLDILLGEITDGDNNKFALYKRVSGNGLFRLVYEDVKEYGSTFEPFEKLGFTEE